MREIDEASEQYALKALLRADAILYSRRKDMEEAFKAGAAWGVDWGAKIALCVKAEETAP